MSDDFFKTEYTKAADGSGELFQEEIVAVNSEPVTCLGKTFANVRNGGLILPRNCARNSVIRNSGRLKAFPSGRTRIFWR